MAVAIDHGRVVNNWCLADWLFQMLPAGTYYLTLVTDWMPIEEKPQIGLIREMPDGSLSGMTIECPTSLTGLRIFAGCHGFEPLNEKATVFVLRKN